jgi:predicted PurR-regulated permease PerM
MNSFLISFIFAIILFILLRWFNNYILKKYDSSKYKFIAYSLLYISGSLIIFAFLYVMKNYVNI